MAGMMRCRFRAGRRVLVAAALVCAALGGLGQRGAGAARVSPGLPGVQTSLPSQGTSPFGADAAASQRPGAPVDPGSRETEVRMQEKQAKLRNDERQRRLVADTDKLLALATQLHTDVGRTDKNILSVDVVRRAEEIEKLARGVKERMRG